MGSSRPYRKIPYEDNVVIEKIYNNKGLFDPFILDKLEKVIKENKNKDERVFLSI